MNIKITFICLLLIFTTLSAAPARAQKKRPDNSAAASVLKNDKDEIDAAVALAPAERIAKLKAFLEAHPRSTQKQRAQELIVAAHAVLGDEKLQAGDAAGGTEQFRLALAELPATISDKLFDGVVSQIPGNLFLRGERAASIELARKIEERVKDNPLRLLALSAFYLGIEAPDDALRMAELAIKLAPEQSAAYQARAAAHRIALRLDESAADYARALELSPTSDFARRSLAELRRATGKTEEALALYRELLKANAADEFARVGMIVSLFELGQKDEAERELAAALKEMPNSLALLTGAAYWFAAHNESARAIELAQKAVELEPRYTWGHIALARGLLAQKRPMEAERALLLARQYGRFPTLDYELASVLAAAGLYGEAASTLSPSFTIKDDQIETYLAGRTPAHAGSFTELLAPERRASIFQFTAADNEAGARTLKALLAFDNALNPAGGDSAIKEADVLSAAQAFISGGDDEMRAFRRLYVASRLVEHRVALSKSLELIDAATTEVETALGVPNASVAVMSEELLNARHTANTYGSTFNLPTVERQTLSQIMRGRMEDIAGWSLYNQEKYADAIVRLRRATSVLPERSPWWRNAVWHLGAALEASGKAQDALDAYYKSYQSGKVDPTRYAAIAGLYRRVNGSLDGLEAKIGPAPVFTSTPLNGNARGDVAVTTPTPSGNEANKIEEPKADPAPKPAEEKPVEAQPKTDVPSEPKVETPTNVDALPEPTPTLTPAPTPEPTAAPTPEATPAPTPVEVPPGPPQPAENNELPARTPPTPPTTDSTPPASSSGEAARPRRVAQGECAILISENSLTIQSGGTATINVTLDGLSSTDKVTATSSDWSALAAFPEPRRDANSNTLSFSVTSISKQTGTFTITFKSPCGSKDVTVTVR